VTTSATRREDGQRIPPPRPLPPVLHRDLGLLDAVGIGFGAIVGAGIFLVTGAGRIDCSPNSIDASNRSGVTAPRLIAQRYADAAR